MVDRPHPRGQPDALRGAAAQVWIQDDQRGVVRRRIEEEFAVRAVVPRHARDRLVLPAAQRRRDRHLSDRRRFEGARIVPRCIGVHALQPFGRRDAIRQHPRDHFTAVRQTPCAKRDQHIRLFARGVRGARNHLVPAGMWCETGAHADDADAGVFEGVCEFGEVRRVGDRGRAEDVGARGAEGGRDGGGAQGGEGGAVRYVGDWTVGEGGGEGFETLLVRHCDGGVGGDDDGGGEV